MSRNTPGSVIRVALVVAAALALLAQPLVAQDAGLGANMDPSQPLAAHVRAAFDAISPDPPPEETTRGSHYWISNELSHWVMRDRISNVGGVYIGVGTEQNYLLAGWARSAFLVLLDFDQSISDLHHAYAAFFMAAETPEEFLAYWDEDRIEEARALIDEALALGTPDASLHFHAGAIHLALDDKKNAKKHLERALALYPAFDPTGAAEARALLEQAR